MGRKKDTMLTIVHLEPRSLIPTVPASQAMPEDRLPTPSIRILNLAMPLMHKEPGDRAGPSIHVLVRTPGGEIDIPVMQLQGHIPRRVRQVPADGQALGVRVFGDPCDVEELAAVVLHAWE